ncbi:hypothetical protein M758_5G117200, partial [Ceratodon purpureus]
MELNRVKRITQPLQEGELHTEMSAMASSFNILYQQHLYEIQISWIASSSLQAIALKTKTCTPSNFIQTSKRKTIKIDADQQTRKQCTRSSHSSPTTTQDQI